MSILAHEAELWPSPCRGSLITARRSTKLMVGKDALPIRGVRKPLRTADDVADPKSKVTSAFTNFGFGRQSGERDP